MSRSKAARQFSEAMPTVVSITPLALEADSRTLKIAASFARAGLRSVVIEGAPSANVSVCDGLGIELVTLVSRPESKEKGRGNHIKHHRIIGSFIEKMREGRFGRPGEAILWGGYMLLFWYRFWYLARHRIPSAALYYMHSYEYHPLVRRLAQQRRAAVIYDAHDFYQGIIPDHLQRTFDRRWLFPFFRRLERRCIREADLVITVSDGVASLIEDNYGRRPIVVRNCHDYRMDGPRGYSLRRSLGLTDAEKLLIVIGNRKPGMAITAVLDALQLLPEHVHLVFMGRGYEELRAEFSDRYTLSRVHTGIVMPPTQVVPVARTADIGLVIYTSISENYRYALPNGFFQIVAAGLPFVYPTLPEINRVVEGHKIGIAVDELNGPSIARAVGELLQDVHNMKRDRRRIADLLSWEREEVSLLRLIGELIHIPR